MFRFNPAAWDAWPDAIARHQRGDGEPLATIIRSGADIPPQAREYVAAVVAAASKRKRGRPPKTLEAFTRRVYRDRAIYGAFHSLRMGGATFDAACREVARKFGTSETEVGRIVRQPDDEAPEK